MADTHPPQPASGPAAKTRNPVERVLVWGFIAALLVAVAIELPSYYSHQQALKTLADQVAAVDKDSSKPEVTEADVRKVLGDKKPSKTEDLAGANTAANGAKRVEVYSWFTLNPVNKRELWVWYGGKGKDANELATVIEVQTSEMIAPLPELEVASEQSNENNPMAGGPGGGMAGPPGGMGGPPGGMAGMPGMGGRGGPGRGRPGAGPPAHDADNPDADNPDADKPDADKPDADKPDDKSDAKTTDDDKTGNDSEEKPAEDKSDKTDTENE